MKNSHTMFTQYLNLAKVIWLDVVEKRTYSQMRYKIDRIWSFCFDLFSSCDIVIWILWPLSLWGPVPLNLMSFECGLCADYSGPVCGQFPWCQRPGKTQRQQRHARPLYTRECKKSSKCKCNLCLFAVFTLFGCFISLVSVSMAMQSFGYFNNKNCRLGCLFSIYFS